MVIKMIKNLENVNFLGVEIHKCKKNGGGIPKSLKNFGAGDLPPQIKIPIPLPIRSEIYHCRTNPRKNYYIF